MFSVPDILVVSVLALLLFGPDRLPKLMRQAGRFMREVQNTSHSFVSEMERAADLAEHPAPPPAPAAEYPGDHGTIEHEPVDHAPIEDDIVQDDEPVEQESVEHEPAEAAEPVAEHAPLDAEGHELPGRAMPPFSGG